MSDKYIDGNPGYERPEVHNFRYFLMEVINYNNK